MRSRYDRWSVTRKISEDIYGDGKIVHEELNSDGSCRMEDVVVHCHLGREKLRFWGESTLFLPLNSFPSISYILWILSVTQSTSYMWAGNSAIQRGGKVLG